MVWDSEIITYKNYWEGGRKYDLEGQHKEGSHED